MKKAEAKFVKQVMDAAKEFAHIKGESIEGDEAHFYRNIDKDYAASIIDEIIDMTDSAMACHLVELFINNLMAVEEIEMIIY